MNPMSNQTNEGKNFFTPKSIRWSIGLLGLSCALGLFLLWYLPFDPKSPPSTEPGMNTEFDDLLKNNNKKWMFLFSSGAKVIKTDIYGGNAQVVFDNMRVIEQDSAILDLSASPDGKLVAINYLDNSTFPPLPKIFVVEIDSGEMIMETPPILEGFYFDLSSPVYWLDSKLFLVKMNEIRHDASSSIRVAYLRYDLHNPESQAIIEIEHWCDWEAFNRDLGILLQASQCIPNNQPIVWAIDVRGKRLATKVESSFYEKCLREGIADPDNFCENVVSDFGVRLRVESVVGKLTNGFGRWYSHNWYRDYIYLNDEIVRISDGWIEFNPVWDSDLKLLVWMEGYDKTYLMDIQGHYRFWYFGEYKGKIPVRN